MPYLAVRSGTFFLRLPVPKSLQPLLGQAEIFQSLKTSNRDEARVLSLSLSAELLMKFAEWKGTMKNKNNVDDVSDIGRFYKGSDGKPIFLRNDEAAPPAEVNAIPFNLDVLPNGQPYIKNTDPNNPQDFKDAKEALLLAQEAARVAPAIQPAPPPVAALLAQPAQVQAIRDEAKKAAKDEIAGTFEKLHGITPKNIHSAFKAFIDELTASKVKSTRQYRGGVQHFIDWIVSQHPNIQVHKIRKDHLKEYRDLLRVTKSRVAPYELFHPHNIYKRMGFVE
ncbi:MAG: DUF6538 domain-containing protein, partial [Stenotrophobium sp.]